MEKGERACIFFLLSHGETVHIILCEYPFGVKCINFYPQSLYYKLNVVLKQTNKQINK